MVSMIKIVVKLNGTDKNPFEAMGLTQNPFPVIAKAEYESACLALQSLEGIPLLDELDIRKRLTGKVDEYIIMVCCIKFQPGKMSEFNLILEE